MLQQAKRSAEVTHNHPEGIKGAQATALAVFMARHGVDKETIRKEIEDRFNYDLNRTVEKIRPTYRFDVTCQGSVPESIIAFLDANDYESTVKTPYPSEGMPIPWHASLAASLRHFTKGFLPGLSWRSGKS